MTEQMIAGGIDLIQLRAKARLSAEIAKVAAELHCITMKRNIPLIINDHPEVARVVSAEGVHVGQDDLALSEVREIAGPDRMVGKSTHSVDQAIRAFYEGADYISSTDFRDNKTGISTDRPGGGSKGSRRGEHTNLLHRRHYVGQSA